jgi:hypothetical protein
MYLVGFAETIRDVLREFGLQIIDGGLNDIRIIALGIPGGIKYFKKSNQIKNI